SAWATATRLIFDTRVPIFKMFHPSPNTAGTHAGISEFNDGALSKRNIDVCHFGNAVDILPYVPLPWKARPVMGLPSYSL
ncbi:hypothetical protein L9F63_026675, partial [Diploptera punctata]